MIHIFFESPLGKVQRYQGSLLLDVCDRFYGGALFGPPAHPRVAPKRSILNRIKLTEVH